MHWLSASRRKKRERFARNSASILKPETGEIKPPSHNFDRGGQITIPQDEIFGNSRPVEFQARAKAGESWTSGSDAPKISGRIAAADGQQAMNAAHSPGRRKGNDFTRSLQDRAGAKI